MEYDDLQYQEKCKKTGKIFVSVGIKRYDRIRPYTNGYETYQYKYKYKYKVK